MKEAVVSQFSTERLLIRCPEVSDLDAIYEAIGESINELIPWMSWAKRSLTREDCEADLRRGIANFILREELRYHYHHRESGRLLACSGLHRINWDIPKFEIGYWCRLSEQGKGYVTEGVRGLTQMAFSRLGAARVEIRCDDLNSKSYAVAERLGFQLEAVLRNDSRSPKGELRSTRVYALTSLEGLTWG